MPRIFMLDLPEAKAFCLKHCFAQECGELVMAKSQRVLFFGECVGFKPLFSHKKRIPLNSNDYKIVV